MKKYYKIANQNICIDAPCFPFGSWQWQCFEIADFPINETERESDGCVTFGCHILPRLPIPESGDCAFVKSSPDNSVTVYQKGNEIFHHTHMGTLPGALTALNGSSEINSFFTPESFPFMADERFIWSSLCFPQILLERGTLYIHSSYINVNGKGIVFCGDCGVGKSTQAKLWQDYRGAEIINGDKSLISVCEDGVFVHGVPGCGTSGICKNVSLPLEAIVLLQKGAENEAHRLNGVEALQNFTPNIYLDFLAPEEQQKCIDLLIKIINKTPLISLTCTPDQRAVDKLSEQLIINN